MIIHIEGFNNKNEYFEQDININNEPLYMLHEWYNYDWFQDGNELDYMFCDWSKDIIYTLYYNKNKYIRLRIIRYTHFNEIVNITPLISSEIKIKDLKNILSIKDNIYFHNIKINNNKTLKHYNINNMDTLVCGSHIYAVAGAPVPVDC